MIVRSWNVFHGNSMPPGRHGYLREMLAIASREMPAALCLQEVPPWALESLGGWSGMHVHGMVGRGPYRPRALAARITRLNHGRFRSRLAGQAQAILVDPALASEDLGGVQVSEPGRERRIVHAVRIGGLGVVGNLHATNAPSTPSLPAAELVRAARFLESVAGPCEARILAGDLNHNEPTVLGYENGGPGVDHILVAGIAAEPLTVWPQPQRMHNGIVLSDHAPVERVVGDLRESAGSVSRARADRVPQRRHVRAAVAARGRGGAARAGAGLSPRGAAGCRSSRG